MKISTLLMTMLISIFSLNLYADSVKILTIEWAPFTGAKLKNNGFAAYIVKRALEVKGHNVTFTYVPWARGLKEVEKGKFDGLIPAYYNEERARKYSVTSEFATAGSQLFQNINKKISWSKLEDLKSYSIGVMRGYSNGKEFDNAKFLKKIPVSKLSSNIKKLGKGKIDLLIDDPLVVKNALNTELSEYKSIISESGPILTTKGLHVLFSRKISNSMKLTNDFNEGVKKLRSSGEYKKIMDLYGF